MELKAAFGATLREVRLQRSLTQEDFSIVSSRTMVSLLERAGTSLTLEKLEELCSVLGVHPVTLMAACYMRKENSPEIDNFLGGISSELRSLQDNHSASDSD